MEFSDITEDANTNSRNQSIRKPEFYLSICINEIYGEMSPPLRAMRPVGIEDWCLADAGLIAQEFEQEF